MECPLIHVRPGILCFEAEYKSKQEFIPVGCVPTAAVAISRCQYWGYPLPPRKDPWDQVSPAGDQTLPWGQTSPGRNIGQDRK